MSTTFKRRTPVQTGTFLFLYGIQAEDFISNWHLFGLFDIKAEDSNSKRHLVGIFVIQAGDFRYNRYIVSLFAIGGRQINVNLVGLSGIQPEDFGSP